VSLGASATARECACRGAKICDALGKMWRGWKKALVPVDAVEDVAIPSQRYDKENGKSNDGNNVPVVEFHLDGQ
jgi:hypothetical protein